MFDLITGKAVHIPQTPAAPILISTALQMTALGVIAATSLMVATQNVPEIRTMMAFVASAPAPAPPPPPPAPAPPAQRAAAAPRPVPTAGAFVAPLETPQEIAPEAVNEGFDEGAIGGVEGGIAGGIAGGIVGGLPADVPAPPPPPPPAPDVPRGPVRIGGDLKAPALLVRVEPIYPPLAMSAAIQGTVILEATVDEEGRVQDLRVVSGQPLLQKAAMTAVRQWRYSPVLLNGRPASFILTVVLSFNLEQSKGGR